MEDIPGQWSKFAGSGLSTFLRASRVDGAAETASAVARMKRDAQRIVKWEMV